MGIVPVRIREEISLCNKILLRCGAGWRILSCSCVRSRFHSSRCFFLSGVRLRATLSGASFWELRADRFSILSYMGRVVRVTSLLKANYNEFEGSKNLIPAKLFEQCSPPRRYICYLHYPEFFLLLTFACYALGRIVLLFALLVYKPFGHIIGDI